MLKKSETIDKLMINSKVLSILNDNGINIIEQLLNITKTKLRNLGLNSKEIQHIEAKAELKGFTLKGSL